MKMDIWGIFWGLFFILLGINIILRTFFNFDIPFFKVAVAVLIIMVGLSIIFPQMRWSRKAAVVTDEKTTMFAEQTMTGDKIPGEHSVVFGSIKLDLSKADISKETKKVKVDAVFAGAEIKIDPAMPVRVIATSAFGGVMMPNGNSTAFGTMTYQTESYKEGKPCLELTVNAVFGGIEIKK